MGAAAQKITIDECYSLARANWPQVKQLGLVERTAEYNLSNAAKMWLPQLTISAQGSYQSDVTSLPFDSSAFGIELPTLSRDQYGAKVEVAQTVWDGGAVRAQREAVQAAANADIMSIESALYLLKERVNGLYFGVLLADEQLVQIALLEVNLQTNYDRIEAYFRGGVATQSDLDAIRIEQLKARQQKAALTAMKTAWMEMLSRLINVSLLPDYKLIKPDTAMPETVALNRPELAMFDAQIAAAEVRRKRLDAAVMPHVNIFATGGYGRPGLNMLANRFDTYYIVGARVSWNIGGLYTRRNDKRQIINDIAMLESRREAFVLDTDIGVAQRSVEIERCREQLRYDDEIIALRTSVRRAAEAQMASGTLSGSDLAREINAESAARQAKIVHEMELLIAIWNLKFVTNN